MKLKATVTSTMRPNLPLRSTGQFVVREVAANKFEGTTLAGQIKVEGTTQGEAIANLRKAAHDHLTQPQVGRVLA